MSDPKKNIEPAIEPDADEDDAEQALPESEFVVEAADDQSLTAGRDAITRFSKLAPETPGVYRMLGATGDVLYVGKAKNIKKRIIAYARPTGHVSRIERMIAATATIEFVSTATETEALLLEANLIKRLRPRFNVLLRDDKSFPHILITADHWAPQILKHRGARCSAPFCCAPVPTDSSRAALARACCIRSSAAPAPARARSISPNTASWCAKRTRFSRARAKR